MHIDHEANQERGSRLDTISFWVLQALLFLTPIFFFPSISVPLQSGKGAFLIVGVAVLTALWLVGRFRDGVFSFPKSSLYLGSVILGLVYVASALASASREVSLFGQGFEIGTAVMFVSGLALFALVPLVVRTRERIFSSYVTLMASFALFAVFHVVRMIVGADVLSFGVFADVVSSPIGRWTDVGLFFGLTALLSLVTLEKLAFGRLLKALVVGSFTVSLVFLALVNSWPLWVIVALFSLVFVVYEKTLGRREEKGEGRRGFPVYALITLVVSASFIFFGGFLGGKISGLVGFSQTEVRPTLGTTIEVTKATLADDPFFGAGPNRFSTQWLLHKPLGVNETVFWGVDFNYGTGFFPSFALTTGRVGAVVLLAVIASLLVSGFRGLVRPSTSPFSRYLEVSSFVGASYLWAVSFPYVPGPALWFLTAVFTGLFLASLRDSGVVREVTVRTAEKPVLNFVSIVLVIVALGGTAFFGYAVGKRFVATVYLQKALVAANVSGDIEAAEDYIARALSVSPSDAQYRALSELYLLRLSVLLSDDKASQEETQQKFQEYLSVAIKASNAAVDFDGTNYVNHAALAQVFSAVTPLKIEGAYEAAVQAYQNALAVNPESPELYLALARLEAVKGDNAAARTQIGKALEKKGDYAAAVYLLAEMQVAERNLPEAIRSVEAVAMLSPNDSGVFFQLGLLYYDQKRFADAVLAFGRAVTINPQYANAKYLLGLSLYETKDTQGALAQFRELRATNPDNAEIADIISNLEAGKAPFATSKKGLPSLPVDESSSAENI